MNTDKHSDYRSVTQKTCAPKRLFYSGPSGSGKHQVLLNHIENWASQEATIFYIGTTISQQAWWHFNSIAQKHGRGGACYISGHPKYVRVNEHSVISLNGMCMHWNPIAGEGYPSLLRSLHRINEAISGANNKRHHPVCVAIDRLDVSALAGTADDLSIIEAIVSAADCVHVIGEGEPRLAESFIEAEGFTTLTFGCIDGKHLGDGQAALKVPQQQVELINIPFAPPPSADYVMPSNRSSKAG